MAQGDASDLVMKFVAAGNAIPGECQTQLIASDGWGKQLIAGFEPKFMFEVDRFTFATGIADDTAGDATTPDKTAAQPGDKNAKAAKASPWTAKPGGFHAWRAGKAYKYPVEMQPVSFTRSIDRSSTTLIQSCINCEPFDSAALIKRKAAGGVAAGEVFLRLDFLGVLVVGVDWSDDAQVQETCHFICRAVTISYRPQLPDGSLGFPKVKFWSMVADERQPTTYS
jgi:type VI protein secretion system component Hcp